MDKRTLYGLDKNGGFKFWEIWTEDECLFISHGKEGGKMQLKRESVNGKNKGRSNETTPEHQAELEAISRWKKQIDKGYRESKDELGELEILPMLAHDYRKQGHRIKFPCWASAKLDGVRCLAIAGEDGVELKSRGGKSYTVKHVQDALSKIMQVGEVWDGELYIHGKALEEIVSAVKKPNANTPSVVFMTFDIVSAGGDFENRLSALVNYDYMLGQRGAIHYLQYEPVPDKEYMVALHDEYVKAGFEGIMLRNKEGVYESGKRSADLQKYKTFLDEEFEIISVTEDRNGNAVLGCYDPIANDGFGVCFGDHAERKRQLESPEKYIGKMLTVQYQTRYKDTKLPQFPTGKVIRDHE